MRTLILLGSALATFGLASPITAQRDARLLGHTVHVTQQDNTRLVGELLAVQSDSLWLLDAGQPRALLLQALDEVQVRGRGMSGSGILVWSLLGGIASGVPLTVACATVTNGCGVVLPTVMLSWLLVGGVAAAITGSPHRSVGPYPELLAPYARFPQGLPPDFFPPRFPTSDPSKRTPPGNPLFQIRVPF